MSEIRASFFVECEELQESLFDALAELAEPGAGAGPIDVAFRAVHSIKGGAAAFGLDELVAFAHEYESLLDRMRDGSLAVEEDRLGLLLRAADLLGDIVRAARDDTPTDPLSVLPLLGELREESGSGAADEPTDIDFAPMTLDLGDLDGIAVDVPLEGRPPLPESAPDAQVALPSSDLVLRFRPEPELYEYGNEPLFLLRALSELEGAKARCRFHPDAPRGSRLEWRVDLPSGNRQRALDLFEFAEGLCELGIEPRTPPSSPEEDRDAMSPPSLAGPDASAMPCAPAAAAGPPAARSGEAAMRAATVRVDLDRIDRLVNLVGELVINQSMLSQSIAGIPNADDPGIAEGLEEFLQLTRDIQEGVMLIRAQPIKSLFQRMARIVRETSGIAAKKVRLTTSGEATELDKTVIERLADPLTHMVRNAVDHGIEPTEARLAAGKPAEGNLRLSAAHRSGRVVIEIADDGGGIDRERVRKRAVERGLIDADAELAPSELDQLLFLPGFSTSEQVSSLSGRGVGMDVVKSAITALGGRISIASDAGRGTTISISLPLTLAVLDGMIVTVAGETLVVPLTAISETLKLDPDEVRPLGPGTSVISVRDQFVPLVDLGHALSFRAPRSDLANAVVLLIEQDDGSRVALLVDGIEDQRQVVIKGLERSYGRIRGIAAATILGDGQIALIVDPAGLITEAAGTPAPADLRWAS